MRILLASHFFHPSVGGIEQVSHLLAHQFVAAGHEVMVVTRTPSDRSDSFPFRVWRRPGPWRLLRLLVWCDVYFQNNISLQTLWPLLFIGRPSVIAHHTWIMRSTGRIGWRDRLKRRVSRRARNIAITPVIRNDLGIDAILIPNPYPAHLFRKLEGVQRDRELVFLGRLVSDKGLDLLLHAMHLLGQSGMHPKLTIVGGGPEKETLQVLQVELQLDRQVQFAGVLSGEALVEMLNRHKIIVIPSRWREPFGLVALEGIACGCVAVGADGGGLPDAIGKCGLVFETGNVSSLAEQLAKLLRSDSDLELYRSAAPAHLAQHSSELVAARYLEVLQDAVQQHGGKCKGPNPRNVSVKDGE